ncbi:MAG: PPC domain-containing protein, partial [Planctomycetaceae bacterium]|nr:PPC domain-containing protein [Planctomycetaceae bacterium]
EYSNDRNVGVVNETELSTGLAVDINGGTGTAQYLGQLAQDVEGGDNTLRLGFQVNGTIAYDRPDDVDVYSFTATAGTEVWIAIDRSSFSLDTVLELVDANGNILASSDDWRRTSTLTGDAMPMDKGMGYDDVYSTNWSDAGMRLKLRGATGTQGTYYIRVHSAAPESANAQQTTGHYQLQVRLQPVYEHPGSTVSYADIRYAVTGIDVSGLPGHSVLTTDVYDADTSTVAKNDTAAQPAGNLLQSDEGMLSIGGYLNSWSDVDWYRFSIKYGNTIENISGVTSAESVYPVVLDLDFADGLNRPDATIWLYEEYTEVVNNVSQTKRRLIYSGSNSNIADDLAGLGNGSASDILSSGSYGANDAYIGPIYLKEGHNYYVAVTSTAVSADAANPAYNASLHIEPLSTTKLVAEDHIGTTSASSYTLFPGTTTANLNLAAQDYQLNDVGFYVMTDTGLCMVDPFTGKVQAVSDNFLWAVGNDNHGVTYGDLVMRNDGKLYTISRGTDDGRYNKNSYAGFLAEIDTGDPSNFLSVQESGIITYGVDPTDPNKINIVEFGDDANETGGIRMEAVCYQTVNANGSPATSGRTMYAIGNDPLENTDVKDLPRHNLLYVMYEDGEAHDTNGADQRLVTSVVPLGALQVNGTITGMTFLNGRLYCVTDVGGFYEITHYTEQGFKEVGDGKTKSFSIEAMPAGGPSAKLICTIDPDPTSNVAFAGLTAGPSNVENEKYANMVFAVTRTGDVYALDVSLSLDPITAREVTTVTKAPIFFDGATSVNTGIGSVSGLAFSTLDYNLWHATTSNSYTGDSADTGDMSFYFGLEKDAGQPDAVNYYGTNQAIYNTYNLPGGAHGSIVTQKFDLSQYAAADQPTLYFHYSLDKDISTTSTDAATVYASSDGVNWSSLGTLGDTAGIWSEVSLSLASFAGESSVQLRFDFTTGGAWANTVTLNGSDLVAPSGEGLEDGDTFTVAYADGKANPTTLAATETFEFDMGVSLHMPNVAGDAIPDGETFTVTDNTGAVLKTFEFDRDGVIAAGNVAIAIQNGETSAEVAALVAKAINEEHLHNSLGIAIGADVSKTRVMLNFAEGVTQAAVPGTLLPSVTAKGDGYGTTTTGNRVLPITSLMTADEIAKEIATGKDPAGHTVDALGRVLDGLDHVFAADGEAFKYDGNLVYLIGHKITNAGPLSSVNTTPDPVYMATKPLTDGNADFRRGAGNAYGGLYLDDIIIGFAERGQQYTSALANVMSFSTPTVAPAGTVTQGYYQLQIRLASDFGTWKKGDTTPTITQTIDTNDRLISEYTLTVPPAMNIRNGATFTVSDGISTVTFQLLDPNNVSTANPEYLAVHFTADQTAGEVASAIAAAINNAEAAGLLNVTAACNGTGTNVDLFGATSLTDISDKITITAPAGKDIATGTTFIVEGVNTLGVPTTYNFQFVNTAFGGGDGKSKVVSYTSAYTAHEVAMAISNAINLAAISLVNPFTVSAVLDDICGDRVVLTDAVRVTGISVTATAVRFNDLGDENQLYDQGQVLLENNTITYCSGWGIVVSAGTLRSDSTGFDMPKALPGPTAPLVTVNADHQVPGVTIENNVIAYSGSGGIHLTGDSTGVGAVPFARVVNNTIYGATSTSASQSGLSGSGISSSSGIQLSDSVAAVGYDGDTSAYVGLGDATPTGTTYLVTNQYGGNWYDAEKQLPDTDTRPGSGDDLMCWAAAASNILAWTGWGIVNGMTTADSIFKYFQDHWTDDAGWGTYGWYWWFTGIDAAVGMGVSNVDVPGGNFYPSVDSSNYIEETVDTTLAMRAIDVYLRADYGVTLGLYWPDTGAGHEITCWGFTYDSTKATNDPGYYTGVYVTDSDDDKSTTNALSAPDRLRYYNVAYSSTDQRWYLQDFYGTTSTVPYIGHVSGLKQKESTPGPGTVGNGIGILVDNNASPTILNNVIAKCVTGISVGSGCATTVIGATSYYANGTNLLGTTDTFGSTLVTDPFVNASAGNFYPSQGSLIID